jgi:hypothetical protein
MKVLQSRDMTIEKPCGIIPRNVDRTQTSNDESGRDGDERIESRDIIDVKRYVGS